MSSQDAKEVILKDLTQVELDTTSTSALFMQSYADGGSLDNIVEIAKNQILPELIKKTASLASIKDYELENVFFACKTSIEETRKWLELALKCYEQKNRSAATASSRQNYLQAMSALDECASKADAFSDQVLLFRQKRLSTDFNKQIQKIEEEVRTFLFDYFEMKKRIQLVEFNLSKKVYNKIKERLADAKDFIIKYRPSWEAEVARSARNLFIHRPAEYPYPILYTREGLIYIIQEVVEHFVGVGSTKYVSRTFEMQCGDIRALIRPKKKFPDDYTELQKKLAKQISFDQSIREIKFLKKLKGAQGIITQYEAVVFEQEGEKNFYQICELLDSHELMDILCKRDLDHDGLEITKEETICIARDILLGLVAIHKANIIHHDLKVNNVLVHLTTSKIPVKARIIDFNYSCFDHETKEKQEVGLAVYSPPEFCKVIYETEGKTDPRFIPVTTLAMDVWSAGCMLYQIFFDKDLPWFKLVDSDDSSKKDNVRSALEVSLLLDEWIPKQFHSHPLYPLVSSMLRVNPADRITAEGALELFEQCARTAQAEDI